MSASLKGLRNSHEMRKSARERIPRENDPARLTPLYLLLSLSPSPTLSLSLSLFLSLLLVLSVQARSASSVFVSLARLESPPVAELQDEPVCENKMTFLV